MPSRRVAQLDRSAGGRSAGEGQLVGAGGKPFNRGAAPRVVADADGIDLRLDRGGIAGTDQNPAICEVALTEELASPPVTSNGLQPHANDGRPCPN